MYLESLWGRRAKHGSHDRHGGWLVYAAVLGLVSSDRSRGGVTKVRLNQTLAEAPAPNCIRNFSASVAIYDNLEHS